MADLTHFKALVASSIAPLCSEYTIDLLDKCFDSTNVVYTTGGNVNKKRNRAKVVLVKQNRGPLTKNTF